MGASVSVSPLYRRGDIVVVPFPASAAQGQQKRRPALVLASWAIPGKGRDYLVALISTRQTGDPNEILIAPSDVAGGTLSAAISRVRPAYLFSAGETFIAYRVGALDSQKVEAALTVLRGLIA